MSENYQVPDMQRVPELHLDLGQKDGGRGTNGAALDVVRGQEIMNYLLAGWTIREIARETGWGWQSVKKIIGTQSFMNWLERESGEIYGKVRAQLQEKIKAHRERIDELSSVALDRLETLIGSEREGIALKACQDVLDRNEETPRNSKTNVSATVKVFNPAQLMMAATAARELELFEEGRADGNVINGQSGPAPDNAVGD